jgi:DNA-binding NtrC family response regulator
MEITSAGHMKMDESNMDLKQFASKPNSQDGTPSDPLENKFTILIADRNPHVRDLLKRELMAEGYLVAMAKDSREVLRRVFSQEPLDLLIFDLDLPDAEDAEIIGRLNDRIPKLPVILHSFQTDHSNYPSDSHNTVFVEKRGNSVERLKKVISKLLNQSRHEIGS